MADAPGALQAAFDEATADVFAFLESEYGCKRLEPWIVGYHDIVVTYANSATAVALMLEERERKLSVQLIKVRRRRLRRPLVPFPNEDNSLSLGSYVREKDSRASVPDGTVEKTSAALRERLEEWAAVLRREADDVLGGDFTVFDAAVARRGEYLRTIGVEL